MARPVTRHRDALDPLAPLYRVHLVLRVMLLLHAWLLAGVSLSISARPVLVVVVCVLLGLWTVLTSTLYITRSGTPVLLLADVAATLLVVWLTVPLRGLWWVGIGTTLAGYWIVGAPLAVAIAHGAAGGLGAALLVVGFAWALNPRMDQDTWGSALVIVISATALGHLVEQMRRQQAERDTYYATAAALGERARLSRIVHDGVLQVLALVEREGKGLGDRGQRLALAAREQEVALRALLQDRDVDVTVGDVVDASRRSLTSALDRHEAPRVTVSVLADDAMLPAHVVEEVDAVVAEVLANVARHAGPDAEAFVLLEEEDDAYLLSITDNGQGADRDTILGAGRRGRLGVQDSICGRIRDIGGQATLTAAPGRGVEWEFRIPREQS